jgi:hypothetical protein
MASCSSIKKKNGNLFLVKARALCTVDIYVRVNNFMKEL